MRTNQQPQRSALIPRGAALSRRSLKPRCGRRSSDKRKEFARSWTCTRFSAREMCASGRPVGNLLFLGPTGSGKTRIVEAAAEILFGDPRAMIKLDCAEFQHSHEIAKLIGSPPGYLGHRETHPLITQEELAKHHNEN